VGVCQQALRQTRLACYTGGALFLILAWMLLGVSKPYFGDEDRFIVSSQAFAGWPSLELLRTYEEMSTPLPFLYWGQWGSLWGYSLFSMRLATLLWGVLTVVLLVENLVMLLGRPRWVIASFIVVLLNPYWWMMSVFAYTDIFGIAGLLLASLGLGKNRSWMTLLGVAVALLSRQYLIFALPALGLLALGWWEADRRSAYRQLIAMALGCLPLLLLMILWRGLGPDNQTKQLYQTGLLAYKPHSAWLYLSLMGIYGLPLWVFLKKHALPGRWQWAGVVGAMALGFWLMIEPSDSAIKAGFTTVGLFDRFLHALGLSLAGRQIIWSLGAGLGALLLMKLAFIAWRQSRQGLLSVEAFILLMLLGLLIVMPLSYLQWEKYFMPVLPWLTAGILRIRMTGDSSTMPAVKADLPWNTA
jgi:4-amino-4-deoxy-L-arabinose transferase-like glycosyltransferase